MTVETIRPKWSVIQNISYPSLGGAENSWIAGIYRDKGFLLDDLDSVFNLMLVLSGTGAYDIALQFQTILNKCYITHKEIYKPVPPYGFYTFIQTHEYNPASRTIFLARPQEGISQLTLPELRLLIQRANYDLDKNSHNRVALYKIPQPVDFGLAPPTGTTY